MKLNELHFKGILAAEEIRFIYETLIPGPTLVVLLSVVFRAWSGRFEQ